jgi:dTDP-4-dehydrorhamnose 3,5-epimerase
MPFEFTQTSLPGVMLIEPRAFEDARGFFMETYRQNDYASAGVPDACVQENHSRSSQGTLRGLHFQRPPKAQGKLVRAIVGEIFDVAVDIRPDSQTFGQWVGITLSAENRRILYIPSWCAHGFCVVSETAEVVYKTTAEYAPELEGGLAWDDASLAIAWPVSNPLVSHRDRQWPTLRSLSAAATEAPRTGGQAPLPIAEL